MSPLRSETRHDSSLGLLLIRISLSIHFVGCIESDGAHTQTDEDLRIMFHFQHVDGLWRFMTMPPPCVLGAVFRRDRHSICITPRFCCPGYESGVEMSSMFWSSMRCLTERTDMLSRRGKLLKPVYLLLGAREIIPKFLQGCIS